MQVLLQLKSQIKVSDMTEVTVLLQFLFSFYTVACRPVARQWPWKKQLYNNHYWEMPSQTNMFAWQQLETAIEEQCFLRGPCWDMWEV
jgi:hypothetical protein